MCGEEFYYYYFASRRTLLHLFIPTSERREGMAEGAQSLPRHSFRPMARSSQTRLGQRSDADVQAAKAMLPFASECLEAHISEALRLGLLGLGLGMGGEEDRPDATWKFLGKASKSPAGGGPGGFVNGKQLLCLSSSHSLGPTTTVETMVKGSQIRLMECRMRVVKSLSCLHNVGKKSSCLAGNFALTVGTDLHQRHRLTVESIMGAEQDKHKLSAVISSSSSFFSRISCGLASSHKLGEHLTMFLRYSRDEHAGQRLIFQAVERLGERNTISSICSATIGGQLQTGINWTRTFSKSSDAKEEALQLKALYGGKGLYTVTVKLQVGKVEA